MKKLTELPVPYWLIKRANNEAKQVGVLRNSISQGNGLQAGFVGEYIALQALGGKIVSDESFDYDLITESGTLVDVKTKRCNNAPKINYSCNIPNFNVKQQCDYYAFVRVTYQPQDLGYRKHKQSGPEMRAWWLGCISKERFFEDCIFIEEGGYCVENNFIFQTDSFQLEIKELDETVD